MRVLDGFAAAASVLSRRRIDDSYTIPPALQKRVEELFGEGTGLEGAVRRILDGVRQRGDAALLGYTARIDGVRLGSLEAGRGMRDKARRQVDDSLVSALELAAGRIRDFHLRQKQGLADFDLPGAGQRVRPLGRVGIYAPGGRAAYPSTVLMTAVPARVAGVKEIILVTPPGEKGEIPPATLVAADIAGVDRVFSVGGAQAIAALAYGTETIPAVDKICGPGNVFVTLAKKLVYGVVAIDGLAGPSEVLVLADDTARADYCAADLLAQAEHDPMASAILITTSPRLAAEVEEEVSRQLATLARKDIIAECLESRGVIAITGSLDEAIELANQYAPEHLCLALARPELYLDRITSAGCIFLGQEATVPLGDYVAGPSHVLPTGGTARFGSPLNITDFMKFTSLVRVEKGSPPGIGRAAWLMARAEGLEAHARAIEVRYKDIFKETQT
ncbi:MAG: histidinol dehydrogenase [Chloroflexota bacterium]